MSDNSSRSIINITVKYGVQEPIQIAVDNEVCVQELKSVISKETGVSELDQRLVFSGKILADQQVLKEAGLVDSCCVYLTKRPASSVAVTPTIEKPSESSSLSSDSKGLFGSSFAKKFLSDPRVFKGMMMSNPKMKEMVEKNPELNQMLNDPSVIGDMVEMMTNPNYQKEMLRNQDRMLSHLETIPEGFNALRKMYSNLQEPMFKALEGNVLKLGSDVSTSLPKAEINNEALPNPWKKESVISNRSRPSSFPDNGNIDHNFTNSPPSMFFPELVRNSSSSQDRANSSSSQNRTNSLNGLSFPSDIKSIQGSLGGLNIESNLESFESRFKEQLKDLSDMGFTDKIANIRALLAAGGNVNSAIEYLLRD